MWTWWFIARDDEAPSMPDEEEGDRPCLSFEADAPDLAALGEALGAPYEAEVIFVIDESRSIVRVPDAFVAKLAAMSDIDAVARAWRSESESMGLREVDAVVATLAELRDFAGMARRGPGIVAYREA